MKKQFKNTVLALALLASVAGVFSPEIASAITGKKLTTYSWQKYTRSGVATGPAVISTMNPFPDCSGSQQICAVGTPLSGGPSAIVRYPSL